MIKDGNGPRLPEALQWIGTALAVGTGIGVGLGVAFSSLLMGIAFGPLTGILFAIVLANARRWDESGGR